MRLLEANPDLTQRELARKLGLSVGTINISEKAVITHRFLKRKMDEYENLKSEIEMIQSEANKVASVQVEK